MLFHVGAPKINISIHALRKESDVLFSNLSIELIQFQSTLSVRRATFDVSTFPAPHEFQSTLSVRRATLRQFQHESLHVISIHALRKESDVARSGQYRNCSYFNPRSP